MAPNFAKEVSKLNFNLLSINKSIHYSKIVSQKIRRHLNSGDGLNEIFKPYSMRNEQM